MAAEAREGMIRMKDWNDHMQQSEAGWRKQAREALLALDIWIIGAVTVWTLWQGFSGLTASFAALI